MKIGKKGSARYLYDSKGNKIEEQRKVANMSTLSHQTRYCDNFIFEDGVLKRILVEGGVIYFGENDTTYHYFLKDHLGSNGAVVNMKTGEVAEQYDYYPFGKQHGDYHTGYIHPYRYNGKELDEIGGLDWLHYGARMMEPEWGRFTTPDPLAEKYYDVSPYAYCGNNPVNAIDPNGRDTVCVNRIDDKWIIENPIISKGDDVFIIKDGDKTETITYADGEYGERVCALNLEINDSYTLGVYYVSGAGNKGCGYYVTPGGDSSTMTGSGKRIPEGCYPILPPNGGAWQQPQVGGVVADRGIRFHYGYLSPREWTEGCFVLSNDYYITGGKIQFPKLSSLSVILR